MNPHVIVIHFLYCPLPRFNPVNSCSSDRNKLPEYGHISVSSGAGYVVFSLPAFKIPCIWNWHFIDQLSFSPFGGIMG